MPVHISGKVDGWKSIAAHLNRSVKTAQRWERDLGLPVHHAGTGKGSSVYAFQSELEEWSRAQPTHNSSVTVDSPPAKSSRRRIRVALMAAAVVVAVAGFTFGIELLQRREPNLGAVTFSGQQIVASDGGRVIWSHDFGRRLRNVEQDDPDTAAEKIQVVDLHADRHKEILVAAPMLLFNQDREPSSDALYCFSSRGRELWRQTFNSRVHFGGEECGQWEIASVLVTGASADRAIWTTACSYPTSVSLLTRTDAYGHTVTLFANFGHLRRLTEIRTPGGMYLLAGGINNEYDCAALAVLKETGPAGRSPQTGSRAECNGCPAGRPLRYFLFPRSEVNRSGGHAYNEVGRILLNGSGFKVITAETPAFDAALADWALYDLSEDLEPRSVIFSDHYWEDHRRFTAEGLINHAVESCPQRIRPITVREWSPEQGWRDVSLPPIAAEGQDPGAKRINRPE